MAKKPKQPKPRKMPKKPKHSATAAAWINYDKRCKDTVAENARKHSAWKARCNQIDAAHKTKAALIKKYSR